MQALPKLPQFPAQPPYYAQPPLLDPMAMGIDTRRPHLYVGNLDLKVTEEILRDVFSIYGPVAEAKVVPDKNVYSKGTTYGFVMYDDMTIAQRALDNLNGRRIYDHEIRVNWAHQTQGKEDSSMHHHIFVGDLSQEVKEDTLAKAFAPFGQISEVRVMVDPDTKKSRGYGFVTFKEFRAAEEALRTMDRAMIGTREIRVNWANKRTAATNAAVAGIDPNNMLPASMAASSSMSSLSSSIPQQQPMAVPPTFENVVVQSRPDNTTVYCGNLVPYCTANDLLPFFQPYGYVLEVRMQSERGFSFIKLDSHENAAKAIVNINGKVVHGRQMRCSWGKDKDGTLPSAATAIHPNTATSQVPSAPQPQQIPAQPSQVPAQQPQQHPYGDVYSAYYAGAQQPQAGQQAAAGQPQDPAAAAAYYAWYNNYLQSQQQAAAAAHAAQAQQMPPPNPPTA